jgi:transcriptional regulator with XRE-family HTH domain
MRSRQYLARQTGAAIGRLRRQRKLAPYMLADMTGMSRGQLLSYETGQQCPSLWSLVKLLAALEVSWQQFGQQLIVEERDAPPGPRAA